MSERKTTFLKVLFYSALLLAEMGWMFVKVRGISGFCDSLVSIAILLLLTKCIAQSIKYNTKSIILIISLIIIFSVSAIASGSSTLLLLLLFCLCCKDMDIKKVISVSWKIQLALIIIVLVCYCFDLTEVFYMYRPDGTLRSSMGFSHPNTFGMYLFSTFCQFVYATYSKTRMKFFLIIGVLLAIAIGYYSDSRGSVYSTILLLIFLLIANRMQGKYLNEKIKHILYCVPIILFVISAVVSYAYTPTNNVMKKLNEALTYRISSASQIVKSYDINAFGQKLSLVSTEEAMKTGKNALVLDNAYMKLLYQYGAFPALIFTVLYCLAIRNATRKKDWFLLSMLIIFAIRGLTGNVMFNIYGNLFLLEFSQIIYGRKKHDKQN